MGVKLNVYSGTRDIHIWLRICFYIYLKRKRKIKVTGSTGSRL